MIVLCPSCGNRGKYNNQQVTEKIRCNQCKTVFPVEGNAFPGDPSERIWCIKGVKGLPVSLRVIKYRVKSGDLSAEQKISCDGKEWRKVGEHPLLADFVKSNSGSLQKEEASAESHREESKEDSTSYKRIELLHHSGGVWKTNFALASFAIAAAAVFFFPLSKGVENLSHNNEGLLVQNQQLKNNLSRANEKISDLEKRLSFISSEVERFSSSVEEFKQTKTILEDIKKSIDGHNLYLVVSLAEKKLYVKMGTQTLKSYIVSSGKGRTVIKSTGKPYNFLTPRGKRIINVKEKNPVWYKPDWTWLEQGLPLPESISIQDRAVKGELGKYRLKMGGGYAIHGTRSGKVRGKKVTHGCIRMGKKDIKELFAMVKNGTEVYIY
jgi:prefoldin subunit 5